MSPPSDPAVDCVLFDLDGTLLDHRASASAALEAALPVWAGADGIPDPDRLVRVWFELEDEHMGAYLRGECSFQEQRRRRTRAFLDALGRRGPEPDLDGLFGVYLRAYESAWRAFGDAEPCLRRLATVVRLAVLTNGDAGQQARKLERIGLAHRFEQVLTPAETGAAKPARAAFHSACKAMQLDNARCAYVGDDLESDARAASAAGLRGVWIDRTASPARPPDDVVRVATLTALPGIIGHSSRRAPS